jgi:hypothetical protein
MKFFFEFLSRTPSFACTVSMPFSTTESIAVSAPALIMLITYTNRTYIAVNFFNHEARSLLKQKNAVCSPFVAAFLAASICL